MVVSIGGVARRRRSGGVRSPAHKPTGPDFRLLLPGSQTIELDEGNYTLFYEHTTVLNGTTYSTDATVPGLRFFVMAPDQAGVELTVLSNNKNYSFDGKRGIL